MGQNHRPCLTHLVKHGTDLFLHVDTRSLPDISQPSHPHSAPPPSNSLPRKNPGEHRHRWVRAGITYAWHCLKCFGLFSPPPSLNRHHHHCHHRAYFILVVWSNRFKGDEIRPIGTLFPRVNQIHSLLRVLIKPLIQRIKWEEMQIQQRQKHWKITDRDIRFECRVYGISGAGAGGEGGCAHVQLWL